MKIIFFLIFIDNLKLHYTHTLKMKLFSNQVNFKTNDATGCE